MRRRLPAKKAISEQLVKKLLAWRHPGFSAFVGQAIPFEDKKAIEDLACYLTRNPLSLKKLVYLDGQRPVLYRTHMNPRLGRACERREQKLASFALAKVASNFEAMDPMEWLARLSDHIPDPGKHRVHFYGAYACRSRGARRASEELAKEGCQPKHTEKKRCPPSWARLIHKVYLADPLVCRKCGGNIKIVAYVHDTVAIRRILDHLGLSPATDKPPPPVSEVVRVPVDEQGREIATP